MISVSSHIIFRIFILNAVLISQISLIFLVEYQSMSHVCVICTSLVDANQILMLLSILSLSIGFDVLNILPVFFLYMSL